MALHHIGKGEQKKYFGSSLLRGDKVFMLFGSVGTGKSTIVNALINNGVTRENLLKPAKTSSGTDSTTKSPKVYRSDKMHTTVIDTCGLNDRDMSTKQIVTNLLELVRLLYTGVDYIIYCVRKGRFTPEDTQNWELLKRLVGVHRLRTNVVYCMTHAEDDDDMDAYLKQSEIKDEDREIMQLAFSKVAVDFGVSTKATLEKVFEAERRIPSLERLLKAAPITSSKPDRLYINMTVFDKLYASMRSWWHGGKEILHDMKKIVERRALWVEGDCPVCLEPIINDKYISLCGHLFHFDCFSSWHRQCAGKRHPTTCPICRREVISEEMIRIAAEAETITIPPLTLPRVPMDTAETVAAVAAAAEAAEALTKPRMSTTMVGSLAATTSAMVGTTTAVAATTTTVPATTTTTTTTTSSEEHRNPPEVRNP